MSRPSSSPPSRFSRWSAALSAAVVASLGGCAYTAPYRATALAKSGSLGPSHAVVLTLSATEHQPGQRSEFFRDTRRVLADLPEQPGLLGYSFRFELFGNEAWTMTAWRDEAARDAFVRSPAHLAAMRNSARTAQNLRFITMQVPLEALPLSWADARALLSAETPRPAHHLQ